MPLEASAATPFEGGAAAAALVSAAGGVLSLALSLSGAHDMAHAGVREVFAHFIESRLIALPLHLGEVRSRERELILLRGQHQITARDLVFAHVEISIARGARGAGRERREPDLVRCRRHVV